MNLRWKTRVCGTEGLRQVPRSSERTSARMYEPPPERPSRLPMAGGRIPPTRGGLTCRSRTTRGPAMVNRVPRRAAPRLHIHAAVQSNYRSRESTEVRPRWTDVLLRAVSLESVEDQIESELELAFTAAAPVRRDVLLHVLIEVWITIDG